MLAQCLHAAPVIPFATQRHARVDGVRHVVQLQHDARDIGQLDFIAAQQFVQRALRVGNGQVQGGGSQRLAPVGKTLERHTCIVGG